MTISPLPDTSELLTSSSRPLIVAHRGKVAGHVEHSRAAIAQTAAAGADLVELDIRLSADWRPFVIHDALLGRTTHARGLVRLLPAAVLRRIRLRNAGGETIPTLAAALDALPPSLGVALHLKDPASLRIVLRTLRERAIESRSWLWLDKTSQVGMATRIAPTVRLTILDPTAQTDAGRRGYIDRTARLGASGISLPWSSIDPTIAAAAHDRNLAVFSVNHKPRDVGRALAAGLDGIITADPAAVRAALDARES